MAQDLAVGSDGDEVGPELAQLVDKIFFARASGLEDGEFLGESDFFDGRRLEFHGRHQL